MTTPFQIVEEGADLAWLALDCLCEGLYEVEGAQLGLGGTSRVRLDASDLTRLGELPPDVDGHPC